VSAADSPNTPATPPTGSPAGGFAHYRRILRHSIIYGLGNLATRLVGLLLLPLYTRLLTTQEYGVLAIINVSLAFLVTVLNVGMTSAIFREYFRAGNDLIRQHVISSAFCFLTLLSGVAAVAGWFAAESISQLLFGSADFAPHTRVALVGLFFEIGLFTPRSLLRAGERSGQFALVAVVRLVINLILNVVFVAHLRLGVYGVLLGNALSGAALYVVLLPLVIRRLRYGVSFAVLKRMLAFGAPLMPAMLGTIMLASADRYFIRHYCGLHEVSLYEVAYKVASALSVFVIQPFYLAWPTVMWSIEKQPGAHQTYARVLTYLVGATAFFALGISIFGREIIARIATSTYVEGAWVLPLVTGAYVFSAAYFVLNTGVSLAGRTGYMSLAVGLAVLTNMVLNFILIPSSGIRGAAVATILAYVVMAASMYAFSRRFLPLQYEWRRVAWIAIVGVALFFAGSASRSLGELPSAIVRLGLLGAYCMAILNPKFLRRDEWLAVQARARQLARLVGIGRSGTG